jgi:uncharacterized membrane protein YfcA
MSIQYILSGFAVGLLVGMTGVGGGSLMTPLLTLLFGVTPSVAVGTDLAFASITKSAGTVTPIAPAPTDEIVTITPSAAPSATVGISAWLGSTGW